ncbi:MAG: anthranilate phosphoribosyltransferase [Chloroflexota bacterium]
MNIKEAIIHLVDGHSLSQAEAAGAMRDIVEGLATPAQISALIVALRIKGETAEEIAGFAQIMREYATHVQAGDDVVDLVGTGGDGSRTFNISTISAIIVASLGGKVAKHGNRGITSACGSADILEALGIAIDLPPAGVANSVRECGFGFMFAPLYHPAMRHAVAPRREIGVRTVFNLLGPITNPARTSRQLTGVAVSSLTRTVAEVAALLGTTKSVVVHGADGLDEISISGPTEAYDVEAGEVRSFTIHPEEYGLSVAPLNAIRGGTVEDNVGIARSILGGERGAPRDVVLLNAGTGAYVAGIAETIAEGVSKAAEALDSGAARAKLEDIRVASAHLKKEFGSGSGT